MKFIINFLGWLTLIIIVLFVVFSGLVGSVSTEYEPSSYTKPKEVKEKPIKEIRNKSDISNGQYFTACQEEGSIFPITKRLSAAYGIVNFIKEGKETISSTKELLNGLFCTINKNEVNTWHHLKSVGYKAIETNSVTTSKNEKFNVCKILDDKNRTLYVLGNCP